MNKLLILVLFMIYNQNSLGQTSEYALSYYDINKDKFSYQGDKVSEIKYLKGEIKLLKQFVYAAEDEFRFEKSSQVYSFRFDINKKIIEECVYHSEKQISRKIKYIDYKKDIKSEFQWFDFNGDQTQEEYYFHTDKGTVNKAIVKKWDSDRKIWKEELFYDDSIDGIFKKKILNDEGKELIISLQQNPFRNHHDNYLWENLGDYGYSSTFDYGSYKTIAIFDKDSNFISEKCHSLDGKLIKSRDVLYHSNHKPKRDFQQSFGENKYDELLTYEYDNNGLLIKQENNYFHNTSRIYKNDVYGNVLKTFHPDNLTSLIDEYIYEYDKIGNWIKRTWIYQGKVFNITSREIEYY